MRQSSRDNPSAASFLFLFLTTGAIVLVASALLSRQGATSLVALQIFGIVIAMCGTAAFLFRQTRSLEWSVLALAAILAVTLWARHPFLLLPMIVASVWTIWIIGPWSIARACADLRLWASAAVAAALVLSVAQYADFMIMEKLRQGALHQDTLFHVSVASMIKTHGVVSTGLNGLVPLDYHVLSHRMFGALSVFSGARMLEVYGVSNLVVVCPLLVASAARAASALAPHDGRSPYAYWMATVALLTAVAVAPLERWDVSEAYFVSESYALGLSLMLLAIPVLAGESPRPRDFAAAAALIVLAALAKGSLGVVGGALLAARLVMPVRGSRVPLFAATAATLLLLAYLLLHLPEAQPLAVEPFAAAREAGRPWSGALRQAMADLAAGRWPGVTVAAKAGAAATVFTLATFALPLLVIARRVVRSGITRVLAHADSAFSLAALAVGSVSLVVNVVGGFYVNNPAMFVSLPFLAGAIVHRVTARAAWMAVALATAGGVTFQLVEKHNREAGVFLKTYYYTDRDRSNPADSTSLLLALREWHGQDGPGVVLARAEGFPEPNSRWRCTQVPFLYPALTERAWTEVIEPSPRCPFAWYGYDAYFSAPGVVGPAVLPPGGRVVRVGGGPVDGPRLP